MSRFGIELDVEVLAAMAVDAHRARVEKIIDNGCLIAIDTGRPLEISIPSDGPWSHEIKYLIPAGARA